MNIVGCPMGQGERSKPQGIGEFLINELRQAFQDVRQKVLEEGWFGRVVTAAPVIEMDRDQFADGPVLHQEDALSWPARQGGFDELWAPREPSPTDRPIEQGMDIDR